MSLLNLLAHGHKVGYCTYCHISCVYYNLFTEATPAVSTVLKSSTVSDEEVKPKVVQSSLQVSPVDESTELKTDSKCLYYPHVNSIWLLYCIIESDSTGITSTDVSYTGMIYYEVDDLVTFAAAKRLNALLKVLVIISQ